MDKDNATFIRLRNLLQGRVITSKRTVYHCLHVNETSIVFSGTEGTGKVMIPTEVALEWIDALDSGKINLGMTSRKMRNTIKTQSNWSAYQHGFETHLSSLVYAWSEAPAEPVPVKRPQHTD